MRYVICLRNPVDVAQSLAHALSFEQGVRLWLLYVRLALAQTFGEPRLLVFYEDLVTDWREQLQRLRRFVGRGQPSTRPETREAVREFVGGGTLAPSNRSGRCDRPAEYPFYNQGTVLGPSCGQA